ncbi:hypothetical protein LTR95_005016 [Oleoguttula sp. CCFEE 5521]
MDPKSQPHIPQTPRAPAPRPRSPPPPGWVDPNVRRWRVENGHAQIVEGPKSSRPKGDGIFEYAGHVGPYQPTSETIRTRTVRRVPRQGSQQVVPQAPAQPPVVQRTYCAPVISAEQQGQQHQTLAPPPTPQPGQHMQHPLIPSRVMPVEQPVYQHQHQHQILAQHQLISADDMSNAAIYYAYEHTTAHSEPDADADIYGTGGDAVLEIDNSDDLLQRRSDACARSSCRHTAK